MSAFEGCFTVLVTPFTEDGAAVDVTALARHVDWQIEQGVPGLVALGSTGEFLSVTEDERTLIVETVVRHAAGRVPVLIGTADEWSDKAVRYSREAERLGADGVMVVPPYYSTPTEDELFAHYRRIASNISIPVMLYNNPRTSNVDLTPSFVARLAQIDNIRYIKDASGDAIRTLQILDACKGKMTVFARFESFFLGARGYVSVFGNILPRESADLYRLTVTERDHEAGRALYRRIAPMLQLLAGDFYVSATKAAMEIIGRPAGPPRPPRLRCPPERTAALRQYLAQR